MRIAISDNRSKAPELAKFFVQNLTRTYISHSELQSFRAVRPGVWSDDLESSLTEEIRQRLNVPLDRFPSGSEWKGVIEARDAKEDLVSIALVTLSRRAIVPFAVLEDIVVDRRLRRRGIGRSIMVWIISELREARIHRIFLESGQDNTPAHQFFELQGFKQISVVMMRDI